MVIDPVTRIEGHLKIEVTADLVNGQQQVVEARATGTLFRGFETILRGRDPFDAPDITARICGVCPTPHNQAAVAALDAAMGIHVPDNARLLRNLVLAADFLHSHILHFYQLAALDYMVAPNLAPWQPAWSADIRFDAATSQTLLNHYVTALDMRRKAHEMGAVFGGRLPHTAAFIGGGFTGAPTAARIQQFRSVRGADPAVHPRRVPGGRRRRRARATATTTRSAAGRRTCWPSACSRKTRRAPSGSSGGDERTPARRG